MAATFGAVVGYKWGVFRIMGHETRTYGDHSRMFLYFRGAGG